MESEIKKEYGDVISLQMTRHTMIIGAILLLGIMLLLGGSGIYLHKAFKEVQRSQQILLENTQLRDRIVVLNSELDSIMIKLELMERWEDEIRSRENYREINKEVREMGIGGLPQIDRDLQTGDDELRLDYSLLTTRVSYLRGRVYFNFDTHKELYDNYMLRDELYASTPSIYPTFGRLSSGYGWRRHPITGQRDFHNGIDLSNKKGTPIYATADGEVMSVGYKGKLGKYIQIRHKFGFVTVYGHLSRYQVQKGDIVSKGMIIGEMGSTGEATGSHLHYEVLRYNRNRNPQSYLAQERRDIALK